MKTVRFIISGTEGAHALAQYLTKKHNLTFDGSVMVNVMHFNSKTPDQYGQHQTEQIRIELTEMTDEEIMKGENA